jgi:hypothetical protein
MRDPLGSNLLHAIHFNGEAHLHGISIGKVANFSLDEPGAMLERTDKTVRMELAW